MASGSSSGIQIEHWQTIYINSTNATTVVCELGEDGVALVVVGIAIGLGSSIAINIGQNLQAIGGKEPGAEEKPCTSRTWVTGLSIFITGSIGNMVAMAFASATILVPLESSQFVTNVLFSKFVLTKEPTSREWAGTFIAMLGTITICIFGPNDARCFTLEKLESFWGNPVWITWVVLTFAAAAVGWTFYFSIRRDKTKQELKDDARMPVLFAVSSALIGGAQMIVHSKALAELFDMLFGGKLTFVELMTSWFFWVELLITAGCGIFWAVQMNNAIILYDQLFIIPLLQASYITFGLTASGIFYQEFDTLAETSFVGAAAWVFFILGVGMVVVGILLLAPTGPSTKALELKFNGMHGMDDMSDVMGEPRLTITYNGDRSSEAGGTMPNASLGHVTLPNANPRQTPPPVTPPALGTIISGVEIPSVSPSTSVAGSYRRCSSNLSNLSDTQRRGSAASRNADNRFPGQRPIPQAAAI